MKSSVMLDEKPGPEMIKAITKYCLILEIREPLEERVSNKDEARALIYQLRGKLARRRIAGH